MNKIRVLILLLIFVLTAFFRGAAQNPETLSLEQCLQSVMQFHPLAKQRTLIEQSANLKNKNLTARYLPQLSLSGNASWQSDVTSIDLDFSKMQIEIPGMPIPAGSVKIKGPEIPEPARDNYRVNLEINQMIYDGNITRNQQRINALEQVSEVLGAEVELRNLREMVVNIYLQALMIHSVQNQVELALQELNQQMSKVKSGIRNGILPDYSLLSMEAEQYKLLQQLEEAKWNRLVCYQKLSLLCGVSSDTSKRLVLPLSGNDKSQGFQNRPEWKLLESRQSTLSATKSMYRSSYLPRLSGFGQAGYGKPGLNMFSDDFNSFFIIGARLSWNIWDWNIAGREQKVLELKSAMLDNQKENLIRSLKSLEIQQEAEELRLQNLIEEDRKIIEIRRKISAAAATQLENGVISVSQYLSELNSETQARLLLDQHIILLAKARINRQLNNGNL